MHWDQLVRGLNTTNATNINLKVRRLLSSILILVGFLVQASCSSQSDSGAGSSASGGKADGTAGAGGAKSIAAASEILIGEYGSFTGSEATFGLTTHEGIMIAVEERNAKGGIHGKPVRVIHLDNQGKADETASVVTRLITQNKVVALLGEVASGRSIVAAPIAEKYKIPMISPSSTNPKVTEYGQYIFRVCFIDPFQGAVMAKFTVENLKLKKVAVLRDIKSPYSVGLTDYYGKKLQELGGEVVDTLDYQAGEMNFMAQLNRAKSKGAQALFVPGYYTDVGLIAIQAKQSGLNIPLLGTDGWESPKLHEIGKEAINGAYFSGHYTTDTNDQHVLDFVKKYEEKFHRKPDGLTALGYDSAQILMDAIERAGDLDSTHIRDEIAKTKDHSGVTGRITINDKRNAVKPAFVLQVDGDKYKFVTKFDAF